eukprot:m.579173 g.579173  ORF g.579173 m.579173 type:complete len:415 (+) comp22314_c0_seq2:286-1530(+)
MGGGGLRILPHKSWHVWNFDNREKVRKDEAQAKIDEAEKQSRAEAADQEARLAILRKNAGLPPLSQHADETSHVADGSTSKRRRIEGPQRNDNVYENDGGKVALANNRHNLGTEDEDSYPALGTSSGAARHHRGKLQHINFFEDIEKKQNKRNGPNADKARDKKKEEEAHLKKIGALVYLGQSVADARAAPWYEQHRERDTPEVGVLQQPHGVDGRCPGATSSSSGPPVGHPDQRSQRSAPDRDARHAVHDPLAVMHKYVRTTAAQKAAASQQQREDGRMQQRQGRNKPVHVYDERARRELDARRQVQALYMVPPPPVRASSVGYSSSQLYRHYHGTGATAQLVHGVDVTTATHCAQALGEDSTSSSDADVEARSRHKKSGKSKKSRKETSHKSKKHRKERKHKKSSRKHKNST